MHKRDSFILSSTLSSFLCPRSIRSSLFPPTLLNQSFRRPQKIYHKSLIAILSFLPGQPIPWRQHSLTIWNLSLMIYWRFPKCHRRFRLGGTSGFKDFIANMAVISHLWKRPVLLLYQQHMETDKLPLKPQLGGPGTICSSASLSHISCGPTNFTW